MSKDLDQQTKIELEAAAFRRVLEHFQTHTEVQNIDLMNLADFCRNCLSKWYVGVAKERDIEIDYEDARKMVYGMPYSEWKDSYQKKASPEQLADFKEGEKRRNSKK